MTTHEPPPRDSTKGTRSPLEVEAPSAALRRCPAPWCLQMNRPGAGCCRPPLVQALVPQNLTAQQQWLEQAVRKSIQLAPSSDIKPSVLIKKRRAQAERPLP